MEFRILGPLEVVEDGRRLAVGGRKQRAVLALLLLHSNEVVATDRFVDELWGDEPPPTVAKVLQGFVSQLRKALEPGSGRAGSLLVTRAPGYLLELERGQLDRDRFEDLVAEGGRALADAEPELAADTLRQALALWRGPALADFAYERFAQATINRLEDLRLEALEQRVEADLALGGHAMLTGELEALVAEHPFRERFRVQQMLALYRSGRQAEALDAYRATRDELVEGLGIDPSPELQRLEQAILRQESSLDWIAPPAAMSRRPQSDPGFVGRERELDLLLGDLEDALAGRGRVCLIAGEPGIGKSRLMEVFAVNARGRGACVLAGRCWEGGGAPAYWPWVQLLREYLGEHDPSLLRAEFGAGAAEVAQILPELREGIPDLPEPRSPDAEGARFWLFDAVASFLRRASAASPLVLVVDDLHAADEPSLLLLQFVSRLLQGARLLVVAAYRDVDPIVADPLATVLTELVRERSTRRIELRGLSEPDIGRYLSRAADIQPNQPLVAEIHAATEGNPFFVGEVTRLLLAEGMLGSGAARGPAAPPQGARDVIRRRLHRLSEQALQVLTLAAVVGRESRLPLLALLTGRSEPELLEALEEATSERVIEVVPGLSGKVRFAHVLIRETLYADLSPARRLRLHARVGQALERHYAGSVDEHLAELAHHYAAAVPAVDVETASGYASRAAERARSSVAFEEAARLYRLALDLTEAGGDAARRRRCELTIRLGDVQARGGDTTAANECFLRAADLADDLGAVDLLAEAALGYGSRFVFTRGAEDANVVPLLQRAAAALGPGNDAQRVRVLARLASALRYQHSPELREKLSAEALAIARRLEDPEALAYALAGRLNATMSPDGLDERWTLATELAGAKDAERAFEGHEQRTIILLARGDVAGIRAEIAAENAIADSLGQPSHLMWAAAAGATLALLEGRFADAEQLTRRAREVGERAQGYDTFTYVCLLEFALRREQGRLQEVMGDLLRAETLDPSRPLFRCVLALAQEELGHTDIARSTLDDLAAEDFAALPTNNDWLLSASLLAEVAALQGDAVAAGRLYVRLAPYASLNVDTVELSTGSVARYVGLLAATCGRRDQAVRHFEDALAANERMGAAPWLAHTQDDFAALLTRRGEPGDVERAGELVAWARAIHERLGTTGYPTRLRA